MNKMTETNVAMAAQSARMYSLHFSMFSVGQIREIPVMKIRYVISSFTRKLINSLKKFLVCHIPKIDFVSNVFLKDHDFTPMFLRLY